MFKHVKFMFVVVLFSILSLTAQSGEGLRFCSEAFKVEVDNGRARISIPTALELANQRGAKVILAGFKNPRQEVAASKTWGGVHGPRVVEDALVPGTKLIDHQTKGASEDGLVKGASGNMVHARFQLNERESTTIGFNAQSIYDNFGRSVKSYVRKNAKAVVVFIHGGGTNTTGHHVAANLMDYLSSRDVEVISLDMPWHAMGDRNTLESLIAELERIERYTSALIGDTKVPVLLTGHSMGGIFADLSRRLIPNSRVFSAYIPLSTVADPFPGGTIQQKLAEEERIVMANLNNPGIAKAERNLGENLMRQRKISPTCGILCDLTMLGLDWTIPAHKGAGYKPALYIIGEGDSLYQGYEKAFAAGVGSLKNTELVVYKESQDIKTGEQTVIGHLIFDHVISVRFKESVPEAIRKSVLKRSISEVEFFELRKKGDVILGNRTDGKDDLQFGLDDIGRPETFARIKNFIEQLTKAKLEPREIQPPLIKEVIQTYINNLIFREFARVHRTVNAKSTTKGKEAGKRLDELSAKIRKIEGKQRQGEEISESEKRELESAKLERSRLDPIVKRTGEVSPEDIATYDRLRAEIETYNRLINDVRNGKFLNAQRNSKGQLETRTTKELQGSFEQAKQKFLRAKKEVANFSDKVTSRTLEPLRNQRERVYRQMIEQDARVREFSRRYIDSKHKEGFFGPDIIENIPNALVREFEKYGRLDQQYGKNDAQFNEAILEEGRLGRLRYIGEVPEGKTIEDVEAQILRATSDMVDVVAELKAYKANVDDRARVLEFLQDAVYKAEMQMYGLTKGGYFDVESYTIVELLSRDIVELTSYTEYLAVKDLDIDKPVAEINNFADPIMRTRTLELKANPEKRAKVQELRNFNTLLQKAWAEWGVLWNSRAVRLVDSNDSGI